MSSTYSYEIELLINELLQMSTFTTAYWDKKIAYQVGVIKVEVIEQGESTTVSATVAADMEGVVVVVNAAGVAVVNAWCGWWMIGGVFGLVGLGMVRGSQKTTPRVGLSRTGLDLKRGKLGKIIWLKK